jgi:hypothetical protein
MSSDTSRDTPAVKLTTEKEKTWWLPPRRSVEIDDKDWQRWRRTIGEISKRGARVPYREVAFASFGISIPSLLSALASVPGIAQLPGWLSVTYLVVGVGTLVSGIFCLVSDRDMKKRDSSSIEALLQDMDEVYERAARAEETTVVLPTPPTDQTVFEDDFRSGLGAWMGMNRWEPSVISNQGVQLVHHMVGSESLSRVLCRAEPQFVDGEIECEVYLEQGAIFNLLLRGSLAGGEFYMARLDARPAYWDCILFQPKGRGWHECNKDKGTLTHHSSPNQWLAMRVEAKGSRISIYRDGQLIDQIDDAKVTTGRICAFAELANVYVRRIRISLAEYS